ncbi:MAG: hypothetical protein ACOX7M_04580 [Dysosmobacter sp.]|jgi:di/tripeptidase|uniref:hypothetical protein n=1 Tax=Dysosmobacter sp. TaxID=2591382 RepID=UPI003D8D2C9B
MITSRYCSTTWKTGHRTFSPGTTHGAIRREAAAAEALTASLTGEQRALFLAFEESRNASAAAYQEALARQAFLLAREIFR